MHGLVGVLPLEATRSAPTLAATSVAWWLPLVGLGVLTAGLAYRFGIAASRRLGSRLASHIARLEVVAGVAFAWLLLDQLPGRLQLVGGVLVVAGVVVVKLGEGSGGGELCPAPLTAVTLAAKAPGGPC